MTKQRKKISLIVFVLLFAALLIASLLAHPVSSGESIKEVMRDAVLHETAKISLFGIVEVNPGLIAAFAVTGVFFVFALAVRLFVIPRFTTIPGKFQLLLEQIVGLFDGLAEGNSPHKHGFLSAYIFTAGSYIFIGTLFELVGVQAVTTKGYPISLPAPLSDINGAIALGVTSYLVILTGGIIANRLRGAGQALKDFSLPISMSFRLFGALLSGALVTELVYYNMRLSIGLPVLVGVLFTLLHALIQTYVLVMLTSIFYGEVTEPHAKTVRAKKTHSGGKKS